MRSSPDRDESARGRALTTWNARLHYYLGLYFLFFIWLFALTGLLLNHGSWGMADPQRSRTVIKSEQRVTLPNAGLPLERASALMHQLTIEGEVQWVGTPANANRFDFRVSRPGVNTEIRVDLDTATAAIERTQFNSLGAMRALHLFTGVRMNDTKNERDWLLTKVWVFAMDALAAGLLIMVVSGIWIWLQSGRHRVAGLTALGTGLLVCGWFVIGVFHWGN